MTLAILFINGMCLGAGILVSTAFGAGDRDRLEKQVSTTAIAGAAFSLGFSLLCILLAGPLPAPDAGARRGAAPCGELPAGGVWGADLHLFLQLPGGHPAGFGGQQKRAVLFDAQRPAQHRGRSVLAWRSWAGGWKARPCPPWPARLCAACAARCTSRPGWPVLCLGRRWLVFEPAMLRQTVQYGWTTAMQQGTVQLGKIAIQAVVNTMGVNAMAAFAARQPGGRLCLHPPAEHRPRHDHPDGPEPGRGQARPGAPGLCGRGCGSRRCTAWPSWRCAFSGPRPIMRAVCRRAGR